MGQKHRVLIIDNSKEIVAALKIFFEDRYEVLTAFDGIQGLETFEQNEDRIDLVITYLVMPVSGVGVISILKNKYPGIPVIAITGWRGDVESTGNKLNADLIFEKPFSMFELGKSVSLLLGSKKSSPHTGPPGH